MRETEALVKKLQSPAGALSSLKPVNPQISEWQQRLSQQLNTKVAIQGTPRKGKLVIEFANASVLQRLLSFFES